MENKPERFPRAEQVGHLARRLSRVKHCCRFLLPHGETLPKNQHLGSPTASAISSIPSWSGSVASDAAYQLVGHDASPPLQPPLQRTQVSPAESIWFCLLQPAKQCHRAGVRTFLQPAQHVAPHTFEGIGPRPPGVRRSRPRFSLGVLLFLTPPVGQPGQKAFQALTLRRGPEFRGHNRRQRRLASLIACSNANGSNAARRTLSAALALALTASWRPTQSQGVAGRL